MLWEGGRTGCSCQHIPCHGGFVGLGRFGPGTVRQARPANAVRRHGNGRVTWKTRQTKVGTCCACTCKAGTYMRDSTVTGANVMPFCCLRTARGQDRGEWMERSMRRQHITERLGTAPTQGNSRDPDDTAIHPPHTCATAVPFFRACRWRCLEYSESTFSMRWASHCARQVMRAPQGHGAALQTATQAHNEDTGGWCAHVRGSRR